MGSPTIADATSGQPSSKTENEKITLIKTDESNPNTIYSLIIKENDQHGN